MRAWRRTLHAVAGAALVAALAGFYLIAASEHAERVNVSKARGDQSAYLWEAVVVYRNWQGPEPAKLLGRNRMPLYPGYLALFYDPGLAENDYQPFFVVGRTVSIRLSLVLLGALYVAFRLHLPRLAAANLTLVVAFGYFVFKAGYVQAELLFYTLFFLAFVAACHLLEATTARGSIVIGAVAGVLCALAHLTKAAMLPFVCLMLVISAGSLLFRALRAERHGLLARAAGGAVMAICFLAVLSPYLLNSKRAFGRYFYNVNTTFYVWYDSWPQASVGTFLYGDHERWPTLPRSRIPTARTYWRDHTVGQILTRLRGGFADMVIGSYANFWYFKYVALYVAFGVALAASAPGRFVALARDHLPLALFLAGYAAVYLAGTAFYAPISNTGTTRFLLAHVAPLLFAIAYLSERTRFRDTRWPVAGGVVTTTHVQLLISLTLGLDLAFTLWPRLMETYGGF